MQNCAFFAADRVCKSIRNARNEQYDNHGYFIVYLQTSVQYFPSPTHYSPFREEKNVFIFFSVFLVVFVLHNVQKVYPPSVETKLGHHSSALTAELTTLLYTTRKMKTH